MERRVNRACRFGLGYSLAEVCSAIKEDFRGVASLSRALWGQKNARSLSGQGTTEYAILVGVLVVIAILAITVFRPKIQELWDAISSGINGL